MSRRRTEVSDSRTAALTGRVAVRRRVVRVVNFIFAVAVWELRFGWLLMVMVVVGDGYLR